MNKGQLIEQCKSELAVGFERLTNACVDEIRSIINGGHDSSTYLLMFVYDSMQFGREFPVTLWRLDKTGREFSHRRLLPNVKSTVPELALSRWEEQRIRPDPYRIAGGLFVDWFVECWKKAGGKNCAFHAYLKHHDDLGSFNLKEGRKSRPQEPRFQKA